MNSDNLLSNKFVADCEQSPLQPISKNQSQTIDDALPSRHHLLSNAQRTLPEYTLIYEFFTNELNLTAELTVQQASPPPPWYINFSDNRTKISGWKDSNCLYSACITYHLL